MKFGCHGSTWELDYDVESDRLPSILDTVKDAGFKGIDAQYSLLGRFRKRPDDLKTELEQRNLELAALTFPFSWETNQVIKKEMKLAKYFIEFLKTFPNAKLNIAPRVRENRDNLHEHQTKIIDFANNLAKYSMEQGVLCSFHPSSPPGSMFRVESDYQLMKDRLDFDYIGYTPDAGHIAFGGMDVVEIFKEFLPYIKHVHFKDATLNGEWRKMGTGEIDFPKIVKLLWENGYRDWIMMEEETEDSVKNPDNAIFDIGKYIEKNFKDIVEDDIN